MITLDPLLEQTLLEALRTGEHGSFLLLDPMHAERLAVEAARLAEQAEQRGDHPVLVCAPALRPAAPPPRRRRPLPACPSCPTPSSAAS